jgi:hypothetical protein
MNLNRHIENQGLQPHTTQKKMAGAGSRSSATHPARNQSSFGETIKANRTAQQHKTLKAAYQSTQPASPVKSTKTPAKSPPKKEESALNEGPQKKPRIPNLNLDGIRDGAAETINKVSNAINTVAEGVSEVVDSFVRPPSPRINEAHIEQALQAINENALAPLAEFARSEAQKANQVKQAFEACEGSTQHCLSQADLPRLAEGYVLEGGRALSQTTREIREGLNALSQVHQLAAENGLIPNIPDPVLVVQGVERVAEAIPPVLRRTCRALGGSPAACQDAVDVVVAAGMVVGLKKAPVTETASVIEGTTVNKAGRTLSHMSPSRGANINLERNIGRQAEGRALHTAAAPIEQRAAELMQRPNMLEVLDLQRVERSFPRTSAPAHIPANINTQGGMLQTYDATMAEVRLSGVSASAPQVRPTVPSSTTTTTTTMTTTVPGRAPRTFTQPKAPVNGNARKSEGIRQTQKPRNLVDASSFSSSSKITFLNKKGRVMFDGVEFRAVRDLSHMSEQDLRIMYKKGVNPYDKNNTRLDGHHHRQEYHRKPGAFMAEIPEPGHDITNKVQHPYGNTKGSGLTREQRADWKQLRQQFNKERAKQELIKRGLLNE